MTEVVQDIGGLSSEDLSKYLALRKLKPPLIGPIWPTNAGYLVGEPDRPVISLELLPYVSTPDLRNRIRSLYAAIVPEKIQPQSVIYDRWMSRRKA